MNKEEFNDICPYDDSQFSEKLAHLVKEPGFEKAVRYAMPDVNFYKFSKGLLGVNSQDAFQLRIIKPFLESLEKKTTKGITSSGFENLDKEQCHTYISNHRDIVLDASFSNLCLIRNGFNTCEIAIGSNLLIFEWIVDMVKLNKSFIVKRNLPMMQALRAAKQLSGYINYVINHKHESAWIAQREGRAKDSNDRTQESLIKMLSLEGEGGNLLENLISKNLAPVSISYEYDPNDYLKAREFLLRQRDPDFQKCQKDDLVSMEIGIMQYKGHVHFAASKCITPELEKLRELDDKNEIVQRVCAIIDRNIHMAYKIYPINYIAYDEIEGSSRFKSEYTEEQAAEVNAYIEKQLDKVVDVPNITESERAYMREMMLTMYANPLRNKLTAEQVNR